MRRWTHMISNNDLAEWIRTVNAYNDEVRKRQRERLIEQIQRYGCLSPEFVKEISELAPDDFLEVMRFHPGAQVEAKILRLRTMLAIFRQANADFDKSLQMFDEYAKRRRAERMRSRSGLHQNALVVTKDLFALSCAASALVAHARRLKEDVAPVEYDKTRERTFGTAQSKFIQELRNCSVHEAIVEANWNITYKGDSTSTAFYLDIPTLLHCERFSAQVKGFLKATQPRVDIRALLEDYSNRVDSFYGWYFAAVEEKLPPAVLEYRRCRRAHKHFLQRLSIRIMPSVERSHASKNS